MNLRGNTLAGVFHEKAAGVTSPLTPYAPWKSGLPSIADACMILVNLKLDKMSMALNQWALSNYKIF